MHQPLPAFAIAIALAALLVPPAFAQAGGRAPAAAPVAGGVNWAELNAEQKIALRPLASLWPSLQADQQRKWMALVHNFNRMDPDEQATLQSRMTEWARLSPAQRSQARLNFGEVRKVPADEKRAKWEEYQALPAEERDRLATEQPRPPRGAAPALRPVPPSRILRPPTLAPAPGTGVGAVAKPGNTRQAPPVDRNTLLPQAPGAANAPSR